MEYRKKQLNFRVTDSEYEVIKEKMKLAGIRSPSAYLRKMAMDGYVIRLDLSDLKELLRLAHIDSNNLNQYAKRANESGCIYAADIENLCMNQSERIEMLRMVYEKLESIGYETRRGKNISLKGRSQKRFIRMRSLGEGYWEEDLKSLFSGTAETKIDMLLDIQEIISKGKGPGYERWAKLYNIKQMAQTLLLLDEKGIRDMETLCDKSEEASDRFRIISARQKEIETRLSEISELKQHIFNYAKTKEIYAEYKWHGYSRRFFEDHRAEITLHKSAKEAFSKLGGKVPKVRDLKEEFERLLQEKKTGYAEYRTVKKRCRIWQRQDTMWSIFIMLPILRLKKNTKAERIRFYKVWPKGRAQL